MCGWRSTSIHRVFTELVWLSLPPPWWRIALESSTHAWPGSSENDRGARSLELIDEGDKGSRGRCVDQGYLCKIQNEQPRCRSQSIQHRQHASGGSEEERTADLINHDVAVRGLFGHLLLPNIREYGSGRNNVRFEVYVDPQSFMNVRSRISARRSQPRSIQCSQGALASPAR